MKTFDIHRLWLTIKWDARTNLRNTIQHWFVLLVLFFFVGLISHLTSITYMAKDYTYQTTRTLSEEDYNALNDEEKKGYEQQSYNDDGEEVTVFETTQEILVKEYEEVESDNHKLCIGLVSAILFFYFTYSASLFLNNMTTKQKRIAFLSLPASRLEKYIARWVYAIPVWLLMVVSAFVVADLLRYAAQPLIGDHTPGLMVPWLVERVQDIYNEIARNLPTMSAEKYHAAVAVFLLLLTSFINTHSTYMLGSAFFPRFPWLLTTAVILIYSCISGIVIVSLQGGPLIDLTESIADGNYTALYIASGINVALAILFYILSYYIFKRTQVISHKFINL